MKNRMTLTSGEYVVSKVLIIKSTLETCAVVCLYDDIKKIGLMYHTPKSNTEKSIMIVLPKGLNDLKYMNCDNIKATIIGGAYFNPNDKNISFENIKIITSILENYNILIEKVIHAGADKLIEVTFDSTNGRIQISFKK